MKITNTEVKNFSVLGVNFIIRCESWKTRDSWGHIATVINDNYSTIAAAKSRYYNRTWERYKYQSVMHCAVSAAMQAVANDAVNAWKDATGRSRCRAAERAQILAACKNWQALKALYNTL